ncbi:MAG: DUF3000 domain-containing protein [Frankiaceae bacterium]|nr:DUF3000 domain-containing protein [Frankiaceae bacterium]
MNGASSLAGARDSDARRDRPNGHAPEVFLSAVEALEATLVRPEVRIHPLRPPQLLAPWSYAIGADVLDAAGDELATGRLVVLCDPDGHEAWHGVLRLIAFASAEVEDDIATDPSLPAVGWSWLVSALCERGAAHTAAGGTVTQTTSSRFGDIADTRAVTRSVELRGSWTALDADLGPHVLAFADLLSQAAGLPPEGVAILGRR